MKYLSIIEIIILRAPPCRQRMVTPAWQGSTETAEASDRARYRRVTGPPAISGRPRRVVQDRGASETCRRLPHSPIGKTATDSALALRLIAQAGFPDIAGWSGCHSTAAMPGQSRECGVISGRSEADLLHRSREWRSPCRLDQRVSRNRRAIRDPSAHYPGRRIPALRKMLYGQRMFREVDTGSPTRRCATQGLVERVPFPRN
jgi:hypothetical protein